MSGVPPNPTSKEAFNRAKERKVQTAAMEKGRGSEGGDIPGLRRSVTSDGAVTVGNNFQENFAEASAARNAVISDTVSSVFGFVKDAAETGARYGLFGPAGLLYTGIKDVLSYSDAYEKTQTKREIEEILSDYDHPLASAFEASNEKSKMAQLAAGIATGTKSKDLSIRRAFPTFKIYFIEDDSHQTEQVDGKVLRAFDDFYSYSAVQEIRVTRSRKVAADLAVIRITNIAGKLLRKRFGDKPGWEAKEQAKTGQKAEYATGIFADTEKENPFETMILQDGVKVQIRLGYASNPDHLETVFLGSIVEIQPTDGGKILEIVCQGFGAELEGVELGPLNDGPVFYSSQQVLSGSIIQDSIVNFGRRSKFNRFNPAEARHGFEGGVGRGLLASVSPGALLDVWSQQKLYRHLYRYSFRNYPQDDNIFAPPPDVYTNTWGRFWDNACLYRPLKQTPWQIFKEHELRHPGYISMAVPYGHSPRMTMFFGAKGQHYWSKPPSALELFLSENASDAIVQMRGMSQADILDPQFTDKLVELGKKHPKLSRVIAKSITSFGAPTSAALEIGKIFGRYKPFRNYHYFDSTHHILKNNIRTGIDGTYNQVEVLYFEDEEEVEESEAIALQDNIKALQSGQEGVYSCKLDDNIPEEYIRSYREEFPSCVTDFMAKRYAQGLFARLLRDTYKGELCVTGEETIKPYDICYLNDTSINMSGPVEVERVEHIFNRDYGFISIITPDLCLDINDMYSASVFDVTGAALAYTFGLKDPDTALALSAMRSPLGFLAVTAGVKFMMWMQEGTPVISTPLTLEGKPFMSVSLGQKRTSFFMCLHGQWKQYWDDLSVAWDKFDIAESIFDTQISFQESLAGFFTSALELFLSENASDAIVQMRGMSQADILDPQFTDKLVELGKKHPKLSRVIAKSITSFGAPTSAALEIGKIFGRYKPFRNYHYFDSTHHILKNNIRTGIDGTYNQVEVLYFEDEEEVEESEAIALQDNIKALQSGQEGVYSCKLDDNIPEEYIRSYREEFPSCVTDFMAKRYAQGLFARLLRDTYKGELCVTGEETIKPYDICYLNDTSINMSGPVEVERVEHIFNRDYGFISIITPDLCLDINDMYSASVFDVTGAALAYTFGLKDPDTALALSAMRSPLGFLAVTAGVKFMMWMQEGTPVISTPLTLEGKPFMSVSLGQKRTSFFMCLHGQWKQYWDDLSVAWDKFDIAESIFDTQISFQESLAGFFTSDPGLSIEEAR